MKRIIFAAGLAFAAMPALAEGVVTYSTDLAFDDVTFGIESAITDKGLVIDYVSHVGEMLERTKEDVGGTMTIYTQADVFLFCSASVSRQVMEADPLNIQHCPYGIFVAESPDGGAVTVGHRDYPEGAMDVVEALLKDIVSEALSD